MNIYVYGATAQAKMTIDLMERLGLSLTACVDKSLLLSTVLEYPVELNHIPDHESSYVLAIRNVGLRKRMSEELSLSNYLVLIDPDTNVSKYTEIEEGTVVFPKSVIGADVQIGRQVLIDSGAVIHSNTIVEDFVNIGANVSIGSNVLIGEGTEIGAGSVIADETTIAPYTIIEPRSIIDKLI